MYLNEICCKNVDQVRVCQDMGIECLCFVTASEFVHPLYIGFLRGTLFHAVNNPLLHNTAAVSLSYILFLQGGNP
jgi:hypothetical protein